MKSVIRVLLAIFTSLFLVTAQAAAGAAVLSSYPNLYGKLGVLAVIAMIMSNILFAVAAGGIMDDLAVTQGDGVAVRGSALAAAIAAAAFMVSAATVAPTVTTALIAIAATVVAIIVAFLAIFGDVKAYAVACTVFYVCTFISAAVIYFCI